MKCITCEMEINPKWKHALSQNLCPGCGSSIMDEHLKNLLSVLSDTMEKLQNYSSQLDDWMLSNYNYIKTDSPNISLYMPKAYAQEILAAEKEKEFQAKKDKKYTVKVESEPGKEEEVFVEKVQSEEKTNEFFQRAEAIKPNIDGFQSAAEKTEYLKKLAQKIRREGAEAAFDENGTSVKISPDSLNSPDPNMVEELDSILNPDNEIDNLEDDNEDGLPPAIEMMLNRSKMKSSGANEKDLQYLLDMQKKQKESRKNFESGENRGGKGGGFSRV